MGRNTTFEGIKHQENQQQSQPRALLYWRRLFYFDVGYIVRKKKRNGSLTGWGAHIKTPRKESKSQLPTCRVFQNTFAEASPPPKRLFLVTFIGTTFIWGTSKRGGVRLAGAKVRVPHPERRVAILYASQISKQTVVAGFRGRLAPNNRYKAVYFSALNVFFMSLRKRVHCLLRPT